MKNFAAEKVLEDAVELLAAVEEGMSLDDALDHCLAYPELRRTTANLLFTYFRRKRAIDRRLRELAAKPPPPLIRRALQAVMTQLLFQRGIAPESAVNVAVERIKREGMRAEAKFVNAVLRRVLREPFEEPEHPEGVLPPLLFKRWRERFSREELGELTRLFLQPAPFTFRAEGEFEPSEWESEAVPGFGGWRFYRASHPGEVLESAALAEGKIYIQDPATSLAPSLPDYGRVKSILDLCAAPGGKSLMLAERLVPGGKLVAADRSARRQELTRENFKKRGLSHPVVVAEAGEIEGEFDLVLADVPCSNTGVFRRRPDALWRFNETESGRVVKLQEELLAGAAAKVAVGGQLVYSTCSIELEENGLQVERFLSRFREFEKVTERKVMPTEEMDGAYACLLIKKEKKS